MIRAEHYSSQTCPAGNTSEQIKPQAEKCGSRSKLIGEFSSDYSTFSSHKIRFIFYIITVLDLHIIFENNIFIGFVTPPTYCALRSLNGLGDVLQAMGSGSAFVPFRSSPLTIELQELLSGDAHITLIANVNTDLGDENEVVHTLSFAARSCS